MSLPKLQSPYFPVTLHSNGRKVKIRPFTVKEEKLLLMASQDKDDTAFILDTIFQVLDNCLEGDVKAKSLATFDVEWLFIQLRSKSVSNITDVSFKDDEDDKVYKVSINLDDVKIEFEEGHSNKIVLDDTYTITMKYPAFSDITTSGKGDQKVDPFVLISNSIDKLINVETDEITDLKDNSQAEIIEFIESFSSKNMRDIENFFATMPSVKLKVEYITEDKVTKVKEIVGLVNFFTL